MFIKSEKSDDIKTFGENVRRLRKEQNLSMEELANLADIELSQIYRIETGKINPKLTTILQIAKGLEIESYLLLKK